MSQKIDRLLAELISDVPDDRKKLYKKRIRELWNQLSDVEKGFMEKYKPKQIFQAML